MSHSFKNYLKEDAGITEEQLQQLEGELQKRSVEENEILLHEGQVCRKFFYPEKGLLRFYSVDEKGVVPISVIGLAEQLQRDWGRPGADQLRSILREYSNRMDEVKGNR